MHKRKARSVPTFVTVGSQSEAFFHNGAKALTNILPSAQYRALEGRDHSAILLAPKANADAVEGYFLNGNKS